MKNQKLHILVECAIMVAAAFVLGLFKIYEAPYGGSVTLFSMAPIMLVSYRHGVKWGLASGFVLSVIELLVGLSDVAYVPTASGIILCILLDYTVAFTVIGLAGIFRNVKFVKNSEVNSLICADMGAVIAVGLRFLCHLVSGAVIWYELTKGWYADDPSHIVNKFGMWGYSFIYNITFILPELILTLVAVPVLLRILSILDRKVSQ